MQPLEDLRYLLLQLVSNPLFQQLFPLLVILIVPLLVVAANSRKGSLTSTTFMVFDAFAGVLPWNWFDSHSGSSSTHEKRKSKKKHIRTRAELVKQEHHQLGTVVCYDAHRGCIPILLVHRFTAQGISRWGILSGAGQHLRHVLLHGLDIASACYPRSSCLSANIRRPRRWRLFAICSLR